MLEEVKAWQNRPLEALHPIVYLDAIQVKVRDEGQVQRKAVYLALQKLSKKWTRPIKNWPTALNRFAIEFEGRVPLP